ncbi:MAG: 2-oxoacid:acceptor oxidoreductase family protein, partial [Elusimicrobia bacterium]|nr:2-oxoacid:acceptor oxidoreductase family protein [Elusimicrobiota bacterium]
MKTFDNDISIVLCGAAGSGIQTVESMVSEALKSFGYNIFASKEYMSRVRGGSNSTQLRITSVAPACYTKRIDIAIPFDNDALEHLAARLSESTLILADKKLITTPGFEIFDIALGEAAQKIGDALFTNVIATGIVLGLFGVDFSFFEELLKKRFSSKGEDILNKNISAARKGYDISKQIPCKINIQKSDAVKSQMLLSGADAIGIGALAGGCDFIASYPMTPGSSVFTFLAQTAKDFNIVSEQAEDEISAINMGLGAAYAGARAMVSTSGGGFALMCEGVSLSA